MAFAFVQTTGNAIQSSSSSTIVVPVTTAPSAGNMIVLCVTNSLSGTTLSGVADTKGNTWTVVSNYAPTTPAIMCDQVAYTLQDVGTLTGADTITATESAASANIAAIADEFTIPAGVISTDLSPVNGSAGVTAVAASGTAVSVGASQATTATVELVLCVGVTRGNSAQTFTQGTGWTKTQSIVKSTGQFVGVANEYAVTSSTGAQTGTWTLGVSTNWAAVLVSFLATVSVPNWVVAGITMPP